ncbi:mesoderm posterior protein 2-like [Lepisosteus oculatus]|uniref:mesoderm posterior protein 2-like n=1 Tax=Lepisosteus oculatus TaxID=7918 RepID=UPI00371B26C9
MDASLSQLLLHGDEPLFGCDALLEQICSVSDSGYYSATGSLSPASSIDSCCFSPPPPQSAARQEPRDLQLLLSTTAAPAQSPDPVQAKRRSRSKYPGKKRQSASEREKLRMRDLTKALHNLRTYLPPSVAPAGQTLTKIETLRLTIRYISHLSAQLGLSEEGLAQRGELDTPGCLTAPAFPGCYQYSSMPAHWVPEEAQRSPQDNMQQFCIPESTGLNSKLDMDTGSPLSALCFQDMPSYQIYNDTGYIDTQPDTTFFL